MNTERTPHTVVVFDGKSFARFTTIPKYLALNPNPPLALIEVLPLTVAQFAYHVYSVTDQRWLKLRADKDSVLVFAFESLINTTWRFLPEARLTRYESSFQFALVADNFYCGAPAPVKGE